MKRLTAIALAVMTSVFLFVGTFALSCDINGDGVCGINDVLVITKSLLNEDATDEMDVTGDGKVTLLDVLKVLKTSVSGSTPEEITSPTFVVGEVSAAAGDTAVNVPVSIVKNPGILGMTLVVSYDDTVMTLVDSTNGDALSMLSFTKPKNHKSGSIFTWYGEALSDEDITDGSVLTLTFDISSTAANGTYPIEISYTEGDIFDADLSPVEIAIQNGNLTVTQ